MTEAPPTTKPPQQTAAEIQRRRALVKASPGLQTYGTLEEIQELIRRFKVMLPETKDMTDGEVVALAQVAYVHGLNPLPAVREIMWIPGIGAYVGIRGLRRKGREWAEAHDLGIPDIRFDLLTDSVEREAQDIPPGALSYRCVGGFPHQRALYVQDAKTLREALGPDAPYTVILSTIGPMPSTTGYGYVTAEEMARRNAPSWWHKCPKPPFSGKGRKCFGFDPCPDCATDSRAELPKFSNAALAMKRSEAHWWKQAADLPFAVNPSGDGVADMDDVPITVAGEFVDLGTMPPDAAKAYVDMALENDQRQAADAERTPEERKAAAQSAAEALYDTPTAPPRVDPDVRLLQIKVLWEGALILPTNSAKKHVQALLTKLGLGLDADDRTLLGLGKLYRDARTSGSDSTIAATYARSEWFRETPA